MDHRFYLIRESSNVFVVFQHVGKLFFTDASSDPSQVFLLENFFFHLRLNSSPDKRAAYGWRLFVSPCALNSTALEQRLQLTVSLHAFTDMQSQQVYHVINYLFFWLFCCILQQSYFCSANSKCLNVLHDLQITFGPFWTV